MKVNNLRGEIQKVLRSKADKKRADRDKVYHKYDGWRSLGIMAPIYRKIEQSFGDDLKALSKKEALALAKEIALSPYEEEKFMSVYVILQKIENIKPSDFKKLDYIISNLQSWSTIDEFSGRVMQELLKMYPKDTEKCLRKWNKNKNMWKRRASVVAFTRRAGESGKYTKLGLFLCDNLKHATEDMVQKGVGWALKDMMRGDKKAVLAFVKKLRREQISSTIILYAIRDLRGLE
ncbi:MAG: hypothetical protein COV07_02825, partial [Candidatus Vogelbacteria bacterium CG10_big_fil_rev_8_21_14_0_10_45_14]